MTTSSHEARNEKKLAPIHLPTNLIHLPDNFSPIRRYITLLLQKLVFLGAKKADLVMPIGEEHQIDLRLHKISPNRINMIYMGVSDSFLINESENTEDLIVKALEYYDHI